MTLPLIVLLALPADAHLERGLALARDRQWAEARSAFEAGWRSAPRDKRFPIELAGLAFKEGRRNQARRLLRRALALDPHDPYANDFLGTLYLLDSNTAAALKYWNRGGKPRIERVRFEPEPRASPALLDRALLIAPSSVLREEDVRASEARLEALGLFASARIAIDTAEDGTQDAVVRVRERSPGWVSMLRGLPFLTVYPESADIGRTGVGVESMLRFDPHKRRASVEAHGPLLGDPGWIWRVALDARDEDWRVPQFGDFVLRRAGAAFRFERIASGSFSWWTGGSFSSRTLPGGVSGGGAVIAWRGGLRRVVADAPERCLTVSARAWVDAGRTTGAEGGAFARPRVALQARWLPRGPYRATAQLGGGAIAGALPFDELFFVGVERDSDLLLRGHAGTRDGRKGSAPYGRAFALSNWDVDRKLFDVGPAQLRAGLFVDAARVAGRWFADPGVQTELRLAGGPAAVFSYSRGAVYDRVER